ncbi:NACHT domain-containing protein [Catellatospora tritici]|uniref:NACHT domain-containing protein n=1 Tax=Catellatospora tritici TaxID=2851566 RepID=UPI001C2DECD7|nr:NACHT domain-containing protein [Catellatospora tritici]MBV1849967.1 NACHT domain-containing protein [Catellatospora tritici]
MREWLSSRFGLTLEEFIGIVAILAAPVGALLVSFIRAIWKLVRDRRPGLVDERRYSSWFAVEYSKIDNIYLDDTEGLSLTRTYVSLFFRPPGAESETRISALEAMSERLTSAHAAGRILVEGAPGSGKSTLLKKYGVQLAQQGKQTQVPIFVSLRKLSTFIVGGRGVLDYIVGEVLVRECGFMPDRAAELVRDWLVQGRCLVLFDGLDEVRSDRYASVRDAVRAFVADRNPSNPTFSAHVIVTCRSQNLLAIRDEWEGSIVSTVFRLAPLRSVEIYEYLDRLRSKFKAATGPEAFIAAVRLSGTLELHRVPLILAMSVGRFAHKEFFDIPHSIAQLYKLIVEEMVDRHRHRSDTQGAANVFRPEDKCRLLREFALSAATTEIAFDEFTRRDLLAAARPLAGARKFRKVPLSDVDAFVEEILEHAGIIVPVSKDDDRYVFAHRSIQEYLVAEELSREPQVGMRVILGKAQDQTWWQVILFFMAMMDQSQASQTLAALSRIDLRLAGHCLGVCEALEDDALPVIQALADRLLRGEGDLAVDLAALVAGASSPMSAIQGATVHHVRETLSELIDRNPTVSLLGGDANALLTVLATVVAANAHETAPLVSKIAMAIPDDPRLVEPLWRCLAIPGIETEPAARDIVDRLLRLAVDQECCVELLHQDPFKPAFVQEQDRSAAYPFKQGLPINSTLVTLLAAADVLSVAPPPRNRFLSARMSSRSMFARIEADRSRTIEFTPYRSVKMIAGTALTIAGVVTCAYLIFGIPSLLGGAAPDEPLSPALLFVPLVLNLLILVYAPADWSSERRPMGAHPLSWIVERTRSADGEATMVSGFLFFFLVGVPAVIYPLAMYPLLDVSVALYVAAAVAVTFFFHCMALYAWCEEGRSYYVRRPNPYVDVYDDPASSLWLSPRLPDRMAFIARSEPSRWGEPSRKIYW